MPRRHACLLAAMAVPIWACATIRNGRTQHIAVASTPFGVVVRADSVLAGITPVVVDLARNRAHTIRFETSGVERAHAEVVPRLDKHWIWKDAIFGLGVGLVVDLISGAWYTLSPDTVNPTLSSSQSKP